MSFSKAKILRFNDVKPCGPPPTAYNVLTAKEIKGKTHNEKSELQSPRSESGSCKSVPCTFKTPTLPKRKKTVINSTKSISKDLFANKSSDLEALKEKIVECENKNQCIKDLTEEVEDLKLQLNKVQSQKEQLDLDKDKYEKLMKKMSDEHSENISELTEKYKCEIGSAINEKLRISDELVQIKQEYKSLKDENRKELSALVENCNQFEKLYKQSVEEYTLLIKQKEKELSDKEIELRALENNCLEIQTKYVAEMEKLKKDHQIEIQDIEFEMLKTMTELQKEKEDAAAKIRTIEEKLTGDISHLKKSHETEIHELIVDYENKLEQARQTNKENSPTKTIDEIEIIWQKKLDEQENQSNAILKECQAISEYNIIQCELEKNQIKTTLEEKTIQYDTLQKSYDKIVEELKILTREREEMESKLKDLKSKFEQEMQDMQKELKQMTLDVKAYQITINNSQATIEVLKKRLINSDNDVEHLKQELASCDERILEYENKCVQLTSDLAAAHSAHEELEMQYESNIKLNESEIKKIKDDLFKKIDKYKSQFCHCSKVVNEEKAMRNDVIQQLHDTVEMINTVNKQIDIIKKEHETEIVDYQQRIKSYQSNEQIWKNENEQFKKSITNLENNLELTNVELKEIKTQNDDLKATNDDLKDEAAEIRKKYIELSGKYDQLFQETEMLHMENLGYQTQSRKFDLLTESYQSLKHLYDKLLKEKEAADAENAANKELIQEREGILMKLRKSEERNSSLEEQVTYLENEMSNIFGKYTDIVGHQNVKQKIKHLNDLKAKNEELMQKIKATERLKKENADLRKCLKKHQIPIEDKENIGSPNRSSPFRERN